VVECKDLARLAGVPKKERLRISYGRLLHCVTLLFEASLNAHAAVVQHVVQAYVVNNPSQDTVMEVDALTWMCQQSPAFLRCWNFHENDLRMWIEPFWRWEEGSALPVHQHLGTYILHLAYYTNGKY